MNKIMIAVAIVCVAAFSQAATCNWSSGTMYAPNADGSIGSINGEGKWVWNTQKVASSYNVKMYVWEALASDSVSYSSGDLFKWYQDGASSSSDPFGHGAGQIIAAEAGAYDSAKSTASLSGSLVGDPNKSETFYGSILFVLEDKVSGDAVWYMENTGSKAAGTAEVKVQNLAMAEAGSASGAKMVWQSVPEPTSGLLLLLGVAGLALRRRRA